jgi:hypothetical protein
MHFDNTALKRIEFSFLSALIYFICKTNKYALITNLIAIANDSSAIPWQTSEVNIIVMLNVNVATSLVW